MPENKYKRILNLFLATVCLFVVTTEGRVFSAPLEQMSEAADNVISNPTNESVSCFTKTAIKQYKKLKRSDQTEDALDCLRAALYFLKDNKSSKDYIYAKNELEKTTEELGLNCSQKERIELAKNLYLEGKLFASAYEFTELLDENYEKDVCYEFLGDIAKKTDSLETSSELYKKAIDLNPDNLSAKYKYANILLKTGNKGRARLYFEDVIEGTNSNQIINEIIATFTEELNGNPNDENNYGILGLAYQKLGEYDKTYRLLKKSIILNPNDIFLQYYLGNLLFDIKEFDFATEIYSEILEDNPYESQIRISRAKAFEVINKKEEAIKDYQIVLAMYPDSLQAQYGLYNFLKGKLPLDGIVNLFYPLEPDYKLNYEGYLNLGYFANKIGNYDDALVFFKKSMSLNPNYPINYIEIYKLYQLKGQNDKAKKILTEGYKKFPKNSEIIDLYSTSNSDIVNEKNNLALSYLNEGEYKKAIAVYEQIEPKNAETYEAIANCKRQLGNLEGALVDYNKSLAINPDNSEVYYAMGVAYLEMNNYAQAKIAFKNSLDKNEKNIKSKKMLAFIEQKEVIASIDKAYEFYKARDYQSALKNLDNASKAFPNDPKVYYYRGLVKDEINDYKGAVEDFRTTVKLDRNWAVAYYKLAETLEKINKEKEALLMYEKYLGSKDKDEALSKKAEEKVIELGEKYY